MPLIHYAATMLPWTTASLGLLVLARSALLTALYVSSPEFATRDHELTMDEVREIIEVSIP